MFARPGASQFLYCGRCKVVEVELPSSRSSLVKLTFELLDFESTENIVDDSRTTAGTGTGTGTRTRTGTGTGTETVSNGINAVDEYEISKSNVSRDATWLGLGGLRTSASYIDLVSTHKEEMEVLFGAYSRAAVEEKRLQRIVREAKVPYDMQSFNDFES